MKRLFALSGILALFLVACGGGGDSGGDSASGGASSEFCAASVDFMTLLTESAADTSPDGQKELYAKIVPISKRLADNSPESAKSAADIVAKTMPEVQNLMESVDYDQSKLTPEQQQEINSEELSTAFNTLVQTMQTDCPEVANILQQPPDASVPETTTAE